MAEVTEQQILEVLKRLVDTERDQDIVTLGMVKGIQIKGGHVAFAIEVDASRGAKLEPMRKQAEKVVHSLPGVVSATVVLTAERKGGNGGQPAGQQAHGHDHAHGHGHSHGPAQGNKQAQPALLPGVRSIIAVASGKGGVGKSTVAVNLALALAAIGRKVGILDSDIYGPSMPRMMGIVGQPSSRDGKNLDAMENFGIKCMSIGFMVDEESPIIWRGPMVQSAIEQMMRDVHWGELDVLVVDMPPGTGAAQLTMAQKVPLTGAVIVSTPQDIALLDARKGLNMFRKVDVPVLGIVENMSYYICTKCGHRAEIFSHGGAHKEADRLGVDFLGEIPLDIVIRETGDGGQPIVVARPDSEHAKSFIAIATKIWGKIERLTAKGADTGGPRIVVQ